VTADAATAAAELGALASLDDIRVLALPRMPDAVRVLVQGAGLGAGAKRCRALHANEQAWERWALRSRALVDVRDRSTSTSLLGHELAAPVLVGPFGGFAAALHGDGEVAVARGVTDAGTLMVLSMGSHRTPEDVGEEAPGGFWMHLQLQPDAGFMQEVVQRATAAGATALCVTVTLPVLPHWPWLPANFGEVLAQAAPTSFMSEHRFYRASRGTADRNEVGGGFALDAAQTWDGVDRLCEMTSLPIVVKGIMNAEDAVRAADHGAAAIIVSNHGGLTLDEAQPTAEVLPEVVDAVGDRAEILVDGGIDSGADVLRAIALGASAVLVARPAICGLAVAGAEGVTRVLDLLRAELHTLMGFTGTRSIGEIDRSTIAARRPDSWRCDAGRIPSGI
jgi:4-hydroxymandelate oxidase